MSIIRLVIKRFEFKKLENFCNINNLSESGFFYDEQVEQYQCKTADKAMLLKNNNINNSIYI